MGAYIRSVIEAEPALDLAFLQTTLAGAMAQPLDGVDLCLIDIQLPDGTGTDFVERLKREGDAKALILTVLADKVSVVAAIQCGAHGYLLKDSEPHQIVRHIRDTVRGDTPISARAVTHLVDALRSAPGAAAPPDTPSPLSDREAEILTVFAKGLSYRETSDMFGISAHTVAAHAKSIYAKLEVNSRNEAVFEALAKNWISL